MLLFVARFRADQGVCGTEPLLREEAAWSQLWISDAFVPSLAFPFHLLTPELLIRSRTQLRKGGTCPLGPRRQGHRAFS